MPVDDTVVWQCEYTLPTDFTWNFDSANKIEWISIKYSSTTWFVPAREVNRQTTLQWKDLEELATSQSSADPIYFVADNSYFIFPAPQEAIAWGIKMYWIKSLADITASTTEADMFNGKIPTKYFYMLSDWMAQFILKSKWQKQEAQASKQIFENETLRSLKDKLGNRKIWISIRGSADLSLIPR
jgi:hypothetical protein